MKLKPPKGFTLSADIWKFYFADSIQAMAHTWDPRRILDLLASPSTECFYVDRRSSWSVDYLCLEITGCCFDELTTVSVTLYRDDMGQKQKAELKGHILKQYPKSVKSKKGGDEANNFNVRKHVSKVMKMEMF